MLRELLPTTTIMAVLVNPTNIPAYVETEIRQVQAAAHSLGLQMVHVLQASTERDLDSAFSTLIQRRAGGLVISGDTFFSGKSVELAALASRHAVPTISPYREFVTAGGLMSYGGSVTELYRLVGVYTGRILKGERPADLPVQQVTKVELVINLKTAKAPPSWPLGKCWALEPNAEKKFHQVRRPYSGGLSSLFSQPAFSDLIGLRSAPFGRVRTWDIRRSEDPRPQVRVRYGLASWELGTWGKGVARSG
jgi:hypothetical protein